MTATVPEDYVPVFDLDDRIPDEMTCAKRLKHRLLPPFTELAKETLLLAREGDAEGLIFLKLMLDEFAKTTMEKWERIYEADVEASLRMIRQRSDHRGRSEGPGEEKRI